MKHLLADFGLPDVLTALGTLALVGGLAMVYVPAAVIALGLGLTTLGVWSSWAARRKGVH